MEREERERGSTYIHSPKVIHVKRLPRAIRPVVAPIIEIDASVVYEDVYGAVLLDFVSEGIDTALRGDV